MMELCDGSLDYHIGPNGLSPTEFNVFFTQFIDGLIHLRTLKIVHRDLKPANILISVGHNNQRVYKISDFGAARVLHENKLYGSLYGTAEYLHPEIFAKFYAPYLEIRPSKHEFTAEHDIWAIAATIYEAASGKLPFVPIRGRENPKQWYEMMTKKGALDISAIEQNGGEIRFQSHFPDTCALDTKVKERLETLLAGMFQVFWMSLFELN